MRKEHEPHQPKELPTPLEVNFATIPEQLKERSQWVVWRYAVVEGEIKKPPFTPRTGRLASVANSASWASFDTARRAYESGKYAGIGFMLVSGIVGIDIDHCIKDGQLSPPAQKIQQNLNTYTERSPSGEGIRLFMHGTLPGPYRRRGNIELYQDRRYLTVTGHQLDGSSAVLSTNQTALEAVYSKLFPPMQRTENTVGGGVRGGPVPDEEVLTKAYAAKNGETFKRYYEGDSSLWEGKSQSQADFTLCLMLLYWTNNDSSQVDRLFRRSGLMREKWNRRTGSMTYGELTIRNALQKGRA
jgi:putative DNA primase/helicase